MFFGCVASEPRVGSSQRGAGGSASAAGGRDTFKFEVRRGFTGTSDKQLRKRMSMLAKVDQTKRKGV